MVSALAPHVAGHGSEFLLRLDLVAIPHLDTLEVIPELILDRRLVKKGDSAITQVHIKWSGLPVTMATWEDYYVLKERFPTAPAWGLAGTQGGGNVTHGG